MKFSSIQTVSVAGVFRITFNRPTMLNALNAAMAAELGAALRQAESDESIRCVVLTGAGRAFCAGQDLSEIAAAQKGTAPDGGAASAGPQVFDFGAHLRKRVHPLILQIRTLEKPVIAAVNGIAAAAGASFALASDLRIAGRSAGFKLSFVHIGLVPAAGATLTLMQQVGYARAAELCLLGETIGAQRAYDMGLVNRVVDDTDLSAVTAELAARLAALPRHSLALTKRALNRAWLATLEDQLDREADLEAIAGRTADHREGLAAFLEKRPPKFL